MRIEVVVSDWEQQCCGELTVVGDPASLKLLALDPAASSERGLLRFAEEHHGETPEGVPHWNVTGTVRSIQGVEYPRREVIGKARTFEYDWSNPKTTQLKRIGGSDTDESHAPFTEYWVELEIEDGTELPPYVLGDTRRAWLSAEASTREDDLARMHDPVGIVLERLADFAEETCSDVASVSRSAERSAVTIVPHREGAASVRWVRVATEGNDRIGLHTGHGSWWWQATPENAALAQEFLEAAAAGRVSESVAELDGATRLDTTVHSPSGRRWVSSERVAEFGRDGMFVLAPVEQMERVQRGDFSYAPWAETTE